MTAARKKDLPVHLIRRYLEPGPVVLVSSRYKDETNIMTMGWHTVLEFSPSLIGCMITSANHSHDLIRKSGECVINIPTADMISKIIAIGNSTGGKGFDKFGEFNLTPQKSTKVGAPSIKECYAHFECRLYDRKMVNDYNFFIFECVKARVAVTPKYPKTVHYTGDGVFMLSGKHANHARKFRPENL